MSFSKHFKKKNLLNLLKRYLSTLFFFIVDISEQSSLLEGGGFVRFSTREQKKVVVCFRHKKNPKTKKQRSKINTVKYTRVMHSEIS